MSKNSRHRGNGERDRAEYKQKTHPTLYILTPTDLWSGIAIFFYVGILLRICLGAFLAISLI